MRLFRKNDGPLIMHEVATGSTRERTVRRLFGLFTRTVTEDEMVADIVYGGAGFVDNDTITYWKPRD